jgi:hypothetical protein
MVGHPKPLLEQVVRHSRTRLASLTSEAVEALERGVGDSEGDVTSGHFGDFLRCVPA